MYGNKSGKKCVIYIRVSSERQVKGFSLEGQKHYLTECAERQGMTVVDIYVEEGKSGKSIEGRTEFQRMLDDIQKGNVQIDYVLVFKLSRFGRNARDVLNSLELIMKYGVNLLCVEDGLDSSTSMGKMMITILGAVAELERENIIVQSYLGREEKAKSGGWNGGFAPYGYKLDNGKLVTVEEEKTVVQLVFHKFLYENKGYSAISAFLNRSGYHRPPVKNAVKPCYGEWSADHIKKMISQPLYTGKIAWGRRKTEKIAGTENSYHLVKQDNYITSANKSHEAFISDEEYEKAQEIKAIRSKKGNHNIGQANAHLLSGIARCPMCGAPMQISVTQWKNQDGTQRRRESYVCSYAQKHRGSTVCKRNGIVAERLEQEVLEHTLKLVRNPQFVQDIESKIGNAIDLTEVDREIQNYQTLLDRLERNRRNLESDIDSLDLEDKYIERRREDMTQRLNKLYTKIYQTEDELQSIEMKRETLQQENLNIQTIYSLLSSFDVIYDKMTKAERRNLIKYMIAEVETYTLAESKEKHRFCKSITYRFPIEQSVLDNFNDNGVRVETVALLSRNQQIEA